MRQLSRLSRRRADLHHPLAAARSRDPLGTRRNRIVHARDGTDRSRTGLAGVAFPVRGGKRVRAGRGLRLGDAVPHPPRQGGLVRTRFCGRGHRCRFRRTVRPRGRARCLGFAHELDRARAGCGCARGAALAPASGSHPCYIHRQAATSRAARPRAPCRWLLSGVRLWLHHPGDVPARARARLYR